MKETPQIFILTAKYISNRVNKNNSVVLNSKIWVLSTGVKHGCMGVNVRVKITSNKNVQQQISNQTP